VWAVRNAIPPYNTPVSWRPFVANNGEYQGFELNPTWFLQPTPAVKGLMDNPEVRANVPAFTQAVSEVPTLRSPLQMISPDAARIFAEKILGARLPTPREWQAALQAAGPAPAGNFRGPNFQNLFNYLRDYNVEGQTIPWRPNEGAFRPRVVVDGRRTNYPDDGRSSDDRDESRFWFTSVDDGPAAKNFVNLTGNISTFLQDGTGIFYVAGGSVLSPPGVDFSQPQRVEGTTMIGARPGTEAYSDVGIRPAFEAPPGFKERYNLLELVRKQGFLTW
jgi:hypothetical protein